MWLVSSLHRVKKSNAKYLLRIDFEGYKISYLIKLGINMAFDLHHEENVIKKNIY